MFHGIEKSYSDAMIRALRYAQITLGETRIGDAVNKSHVPRKGDTLGLDQRPENAITAALQKYDPYCVTITEERGAVNPFAADGPMAVSGARTFFVCDPFDRSNQAREFLSEIGKDNEKVINVIRRAETRQKWESRYSKPVSITGFTSAITCVRRGLPIAAVIINHLAEELVLACAAGVYQVKLPRDLSVEINLDFVQGRGKRILFPQPSYSEQQKVVAFIGKPERGYPKNFSNCKLVADADLEHHLHYSQPGGPSRVLYLSNLQPQNQPVGVVVANGEKIGEWTHWLPFLRFARRNDDLSSPALRLFEVSQDQSHMIDGYLMMPSADYSLFTSHDERRGRFFISSDKLQAMTNPSKYRATLVLIPASNRWALSMVEQYGYREIVF